MIQPLNYCRSLKKQLLSGVWTNHVALKKALTLIEESVKFILPEGGRPLDDKQCLALGGDMPLSLPFGKIAIEYKPLRGEGDALFDEHYPDGPRVAKTIIFAWESDEHIYAWPIWEFKGYPEVWKPWSEFRIPRNAPILERSSDGARFHVEVLERKANPLDMREELGALASFLNALACVNVGSQAVEARKKVAKHCRDALPFDEYRILTIGSGRGRRESELVGSHRSPREHLRRGHVRRLETGVNVWVNATVVNAGVGGKIEKDYRIAA